MLAVRFCVTLKRYSLFNRYYPFEGYCDLEFTHLMLRGNPWIMQLQNDMNSDITFVSQI